MIDNSESDRPNGRQRPGENISCYLSSVQAIYVQGEGKSCRDEQTPVVNSPSSLAVKCLIREWSRMVKLTVNSWSLGTYLHRNFCHGAEQAIPCWPKLRSELGVLAIIVCEHVHLHRPCTTCCQPKCNMTTQMIRAHKQVVATAAAMAKYCRQVRKLEKGIFVLIGR